MGIFLFCRIYRQILTPGYFWISNNKSIQTEAEEWSKAQKVHSAQNVESDLNEIGFVLQGAGNGIEQKGTVFKGLSSRWRSGVFLLLKVSEAKRQCNADNDAEQAGQKGVLET